MRRTVARSTRSRLALPLAAVPLVAAVAAAAPLGAQYVEGKAVFFTLHEDGDEPTRGVVYVADGRARIEMDGEDGDERRGDYLLLSRDGRTLTIVRPRERTYTVMEAEKFERMVGKALRAVSATPMLDFKVTDTELRTETLGAGPTIAGLPTRHHRLVQRYTLDVGAFGETDTERHEVVADYWVSPGLELPRNPLVELVASAQSALAQTDARFTHRTAETRRRLLTGAPLRMTITSRELGATRETPERLTYEVTRIMPASVDRRALSVPDGYRRADSDSFSARY